MYRAGLGPEGRPAGVFLLLGPTGTGKTRTVEALADALHGSEKNLVRVDCGEFQMEHEIAKLIGAPPGYLGHRETPPMLTQQKLGAVTSEGSKLALVLFDEIEKAAPSMTRLLLGVLDKAVLRLGDNTSVNFERTLIFLTSNLGASAMRKEVLPDFGFGAGCGGSGDGTLRQAVEHRAGRGETKIRPGIRQPDRRRGHLSAAGRATRWRRFWISRSPRSSGISRSAWRSGPSRWNWIRARGAFF